MATLYEVQFRVLDVMRRRGMPPSEFVARLCARCGASICARLLEDAVAELAWFAVLRGIDLVDMSTRC